MQINAVTSYAVEGRVAIITINNPPVNALSAIVRQGIVAGVERANAASEVAAIVLTCAGRTFFAGADITEIGKPPVSPTLREAQRVVEDAAKPVVAAIHGTALGGGLEMALVAHYRIGTPSAKFGLPEVNLGLLPGAGGTQRLPRVVGVPMALEMVTSGAPVTAATALETGLLDELAREDALLADAVTFAERVAGRRPLVKVSERTEKLAAARNNPEIVADFRRANAKRFRGLLAPEYCIRCLEAALSDRSFDEALAYERELFDALVADSQSAAQRHLFFAERRAAKVDGLPAEAPTLPIERVAVIGAGTMGGGIAMNFVNAGISVTLVETSREALDRGLGVIRKNYEASAAKGKLETADVESRMALIAGTLSLADVSDADLVIEAVFEDLDIKREVFGRLDSITRPGAILATNTSYLDIEEIAKVTRRPDHVIGLHFFSPANVMKLVEVVRTKETDSTVIATAMRLAKTIGKVGVLVGNGFGFVGNRILYARNAQADQLVLEGATPWAVDKVLYEFGFPMGHFQMRDLVGLDVGWNRENSRSSNVREILNEMGRHGQKSNGGYYDYDENRRQTPSPLAMKVIEDFARRQNIARHEVSDEEIHDRILFGMVNEGARILEEGIAMRPSDIDVIWVTGYGWPKYRGGPMFWADLVGLANVRDKLKTLELRHGESFRCSSLIERLVAEGKSFGDL